MVRKRVVKRSPAVWFSLSLVAILSGLLGGAGNNAVRAAGDQYQLVANWAQLPTLEEFGGVSGVDVDAKGIVYAFRRNAGNIWMLDSNGKFLRQWGQGIAKTTHSILVDRDGFIWTTDTGGHQVKKSRADGTLVMTLGKRDVPGNGPDTFNGPSSVVVTPNGDFFVTDGYGNSRVVKFNKDGKYIKEWGTKGSGPGQFNLPHAIVQDSRGRLLVGDRSNNRIQIFDTEGQFLDQWTHLGSPYGLYLKDDKLYVGDFGRTGENRVAGGGEGLAGKISIADVRTGKLLDTIEGTPNVHGVAADSAGNVYVASNSKFYLKKFAKVSGKTE